MSRDAFSPVMGSRRGSDRLDRWELFTIAELQHLCIGLYRHADVFGGDDEVPDFILELRAEVGQALDRAIAREGAS